MEKAFKYYQVAASEDSYRVRKSLLSIINSQF